MAYVLRIAKYTFAMTLLLIALSTLTTMLIGVDSFAALSFKEYFAYQLVPSSIVVTMTYALIAKGNVRKAKSYAVGLFVFSFLFGMLVMSLLLQELYVSQTWFVELAISAISAIVGTLVGIKWHTENSTCAS